MKKFWIILSVGILIIIIFLSLLITLFPKKYVGEIQNSASNYGLSISMVASIINIESGYDENARSDMGAMGLMQILPSTAKECADKMGISFREEDLFNAKINIEIGCYYLRYLLDMFNGNITNVLCAYNWGMGNVKNWISMGNVDKNGTIINIPIKETKDYLKKYDISKYIYEKIYKY